MAATIQELAAFPLFAGLCRDVLELIVAHVRRREHASGQTIVLEGEACRDVCFVFQGWVRKRQISLEGREHVLAYVGPGGCFDLVPALDGGASLSSVDALTDTTLYAIPCSDFARLAREHSELSAATMQHLSGEVRRLSDMVRDLALLTVRARLARFLLTHVRNAPSEQRWTQEMIANRIGTVRDVVGRVLRTFVEEGLIRRERGQIVVVGRDALEAEAQA